MKYCKMLTLIAVALLMSVNVHAATTIAHWSMDYTGSANPVVADSATDPGQGTLTGGLPDAAEVDNLYFFPEGGYVAGYDTPPSSMFNAGFSGGSESFYPGYMQGQTGAALFFPQDGYGNEFDFADSFTIEGFFKTDGDQSQNGFQQILTQDEVGFSYNLTLNEGGEGALMFAVNTIAGGTGQITTVAAGGPGIANFADGTWHYFAARYDDRNDRFSITVMKENGSVFAASTKLPTGSELLHEGAGNMLIGRESFASGSRNFNGFIDELRFSQGLVEDTQLMGAVPVSVSVIAPEDGQQNVFTADAQLEWWGDEEVIASYDVYFGESETQLTLLGNTAETAFTALPTLDPATTYYWKVDGRDASNNVVVNGSVWSFTTRQAPQKVLEWKMDASSGSTVQDYSGNGNDGIFDGWANPVWTTGFEGNCLSFNGGGTVVKQNASNLPLAAENSWTMNLFVQVDNPIDQETIIAGMGDQMFTGSVNTEDPSADPNMFGSIRYIASFPWSGITMYGNRADVESHVPVTEDAWQMITATYDGWSDQCTLYQDGSQIGSAQIGLSDASAVVKAATYQNIWSNTLNFVGKLDEFTIYDQALSPAEVGAMSPWAYGPAPANGQQGIAINASLTWNAGKDALSHDVYFGTDPNMAFQGNQTSTTFDPGTLEWGTTYYWRVDEIDSLGNTLQGKTWTFTTIVPQCDPPLPGDLDGNCYVDLRDFAAMAENWLNCNLIPQEACEF
ncbi:hypothetical protein STSP2_02111 [Anaerohalosphaera lusitana]|uniref:LamG-like jellyroll fold domain-containing protein n=1 Tax=Anaerohalosphaera lusitana TaxID=1936003 RepID=A0A1U9NMH3_9BACT|nr:LamG domain-containing protein [Anaerohalosphaera lusitana]AQT68934.1 hypothetical protein STSP2_02111 [Anaerohalosphaera lusitana]